MTSDGAILALDVGTSSCRASLYDLQARAIPHAAAHVTYAPHVTLDGGAELDANALFDDLCRTIDELLHNASADQPRIQAVAASTFWHSLLGVDANGNPLTPLYLWLDARARGQMALLRERFDEHEIHARTGCVLHWTYWPARLSWLKETDAQRFNTVTRWISFGEFFLQRLTGSTNVSLSMASGTGLFDIHTCQWYAPLLDALDLDPERLGTLADVQLNTTAATTRWPQLKGVPWLPAVGDGACSNLGAGCASPNRFALMIGTSGAERAVWSPPADLSHTQTQTFPWGLWCYRVDAQRTIMGGALNDGGSLLDWLRGALQLPEFKAAEAELETMEPDSHGLTVLPLWGGERNPGWADDARGAIIGLRLSTSPTAILRACLEGVALRFMTFDALLTSALPDARELIATGGALLHSPAWMQIIADALGRPVLASAEAEASSRGAALLGLRALGELQEDPPPQTTARYEPVAAHTQRYRAAAERQRRLYDAVVS